MEAFKRVVKIATCKIGPWQVPVFVTIDFDGERLTLTGVEGPRANGDAWGSCGQLGLHDRAAHWRENYTAEDGIDLVRLLAVWERWHLNDMHAGCEHQRTEGWEKRPIDPNKPTYAYGKHFVGQRSDSWNMLTWVTRSEHPDGLLCE